MKNDLISKSALISDLLSKSFYPSIVKGALKRAPVIDAEPLRHAHWIKLAGEGDFGTESYQCSNCGRDITIKWMYEETDKDYPYCHCGAKMDEVQVSYMPDDMKEFFTANEDSYEDMEKFIKNYCANTKKHNCDTCILNYTEEYCPMQVLDELRYKKMWKEAYVNLKRSALKSKWVVKDGTNR